MSNRPKKNRSIGRNSSALLQIILAGFAVIFVSLSLQSLSPKYDLTQQKTYSLSQYTENLLHSDMMDGRNISITIFTDQNSPYYPRIKSILEEYQRLSNGRIDLKVIDARTHKNAATKFKERIKFRPKTDENYVIIEDSKSQSPAIIAVSDLLTYEINLQNARQLSGYKIEDTITTYILNLIESDRRTVYLVSNNTDSVNLTEDGIGKSLQLMYRNQNIDISLLDLSTIDSVPENASGLVILTPQYDLAKDDMDKLVRYWLRPKSSLFMILDPTKRPSGLRSFLREHGITLRNDRIYKTKDNTLSTKTVALFTHGFLENDSLAGKSSIFEGVSSSLEVRENAEDLTNRRIFPIALLQATKKHYSESRFTEPKADFNQNEDINNKVYLAAAVIRGNESNDEIADLSSRMVALSTSEFLEPSKILPEQVDFIKNSINWLVGRPELIGIGPKPLVRYKLNLVPEEAAKINRITMIFLPLAFLMIGAFVWNLRRP